MDAERARILQQPETSPAVAVTSTNMCYIIFTSGSTGRPKGTVLQHAGVVNYFLSLVEYAPHLCRLCSLANWLLQRSMHRALVLLEVCR